MAWLTMWFFLRALIGLAAAYFTSLKPMLLLEQAISLWPPTGQHWLERVAASPLMRWDAHWYLKIITEGYSPDNGTTQFHPLYPLLAKGLASLGIHPAFSLLLVSSICSLGFLWVCHKLAAEDMPAEQAKFSLLFLLIFPISVVLFLPYSEATFLFFAAASLYTARQKKWLLAGLAAALATLTRQQGILLLLPLLWMGWAEYTERKDQRLGVLLAKSAWITGMLALAELVWMGFRWRIGDFIPDFSSLHAFIYSVIISPRAIEVVPQQAFLPPWQVLWAVIQKSLAQPDIDNWVNIIGILVYLVLLGVAWPANRKEERLYNSLIFLTSFMYFTGPIHPTMGILRHCYLAFPIFLGTGSRIQSRVLRLVLMGISTLGMLVIILLYVFETWVL